MNISLGAKFKHRSPFHEFTYLINSSKFISFGALNLNIVFLPETATATMTTTKIAKFILFFFFLSF
jgi:hypothetical protein